MKSTKKSLLLSALSLLLCFAMLVGTTFAWFTDSVTSGVNKIQAGNLDVELYHTSKLTTEETKVTSDTANLFKDVTLWEPGAYCYETFTVKNVGNLALKYKMALNVAAYTSYNGHDLTEVLKVATLESVPTSRANITGGTALRDWSLNSDNTTLLPNTEKTFTVAIYWEPTDHDNDFNMNNGRPQPLSVDLGVTLLATQVEHESDSFDNLYDHDADNTLDTVTKVETAMASQTAVAGQATTFTAPVAPAMDTTTVEFDADTLAAGDYSLSLSTTDLPNSLDFEPVGNYIVAADAGTASNTPVATIKLNLVDENGNPAFTTAADGKKAKITTKIAAGLTNVGVGYSGTATAPEITDVTYNDTTGELTFCTNHFSDYYAVGDGAAYNMNTCATYGTLQAAVGALAADNTVMLLKNVDENITVESGKNFTLDLNGFTINGKKVNQSPAVTNNGTLVITDSSESGTGKIMREDKPGDSSPYYVIDNQGVMTIDKANVYNEATHSTGGATLIRSGVGASPALTINDGTFINKDYAVVKIEKGNLTINGGTFDSGDQFTAVQIYGNAVINGGSFSKGITKESAGTLLVNGGNFKYIPSYIGANSFMIVDKSKSFAESYQYQVRLKGNEPTKYDAKVVKDTGAAAYYIGKTPEEGANAALDATYTGYTVYFYTAPTTTKTVTSQAIYAWFADGVTPTGFVADTGLELTVTMDPSTGVITYKGVVNEKTAIASITNESGTQYFSDVRNAVNAAKDGETVKLLKDYAYSGQPTNVCVNFNGNAVTIDLNGHTLSNVNFVSVKNGKNQTITIIDSVGNGASEGYINNYIDNSNLVIKGGTYSNYVFAQKGTITIEGGTFHGDLAEKSYVGNGINLPNPDGKSGELVIKGGTFDKDPTAYVADGYQAVKNGSTWTVTKTAN